MSAWRLLVALLLSVLCVLCLSSVVMADMDPENADADADAGEELEAEEGVEDLPEGFERVDDMRHPSSLDFGEEDMPANAFGTLHDDADFPDAPPHSHDGQPQVKMHSLWITPVLDVNVGPIVTDEMRTTLVTLGTTAWAKYKANTEEAHHTVEAFLHWQAEAVENNVTSLAQELSPAAFQAIALVKLLALEAAESLLLASGTEAGMGTVMEDPSKLRLSVMVFDNPGASLPVTVSPDASVKGVYFASADFDTTPPIVFDDPRKGGPFTSNSYEAAPEVQDLLMFPAWLEHSVPGASGANPDTPTVMYGFEIQGSHDSLVEVSFSEGGDGVGNDEFDEYMEGEGGDMDWMDEEDGMPGDEDEEDVYLETADEE